MIQKLLLIIRLLFLKFSNSFSGKLFIPNAKLLFFGIFFVFSNNYGQSASNYCFTTSTGTYNTLAGVSGVTNAGGMPTFSTDDVISNPITMPFVFTFGGLGYNQVKISNNGWLTFGSATDSQYANTSANAESSKPILFPFWDDLVYANNNSPRYLTTGSSPNRIFKIEWVQQYFYNGNTGDMLSFQVWLYEGSNRIEYRYKTTSNNVGTTITSSIGIYDSNSTYLTLNNAGANPTAQTGTFTTNINARPANNQIYTFTPDVTTSLGSYEFCIDKTNTQTTGNASAGQYALVNVIKGFKYTFAVGDVFSGFSEKLNILDASTGLDVSPAATNSSATGATITNWEPQFSGQVKVVLSTGTCAGIGTVGTGGITLTLNSVGNKQDSQISTPVANNTWRGHIYNWTSATLPPGGASPPALPTTTPFSDAEYVGYYDETTESITKNFGGDDVCFPILSNDVQRATIRTEQFAVRYRMNSTKSGCYLVTLRADDGVRLYVDGVRVATQWGDQSATTYSNVLINLTGTSVLVLDYYENAGVNILEFSMTPFLASSNTITAPASTTVCTGTAPGLIDGSSYPYNGAAVNPTIKFQWESAPQVSGAPGTWTNVTTGTGITAEDYTPAAIIGNISTNVTYYRRTVSAVASNASTCSYSSAPISITTNPKPVISNMTTSACSGTTFTVTPTNGVNGTVPTGTTYSWGAPTGTNFSGGQASTGTQSNISGTLSTTTTATATATYTITPTTGGCPGNTFTIIVTLNPLPTISGTLNVCAGSTTSLTGLGTPNSTNPWTSSSTSVATVSNTGIVTGVAAGTSVITYTNNNGCSVTANITVNPLPSTPTVGTITNVSCASLGSVVLSNLPAGNWTITQTGFASASYSPIPGTSSYTVTGLAAGGYYFTVNNGTCTSTQTALVTIGDQPTVTWNGTTWLGGTPDATKKAIVTSVTPDQPFTADVSACSLIITSPDPVIVSTGVTLKITNAVTTNGQLTFKNNSSLVQINNVANTGDIYYERTSPPIFQKDYLYWSTPVSPQRLIDVSPFTTSTKYFGNDGTQWVQTNRTNNMVTGKGYIIRGPDTYNNLTRQTFTALFKGVPNNGDLQGEVLIAGNYHLIGNPYPSALSADDLIGQNAILNGTIYFWTHNTPAKPTPTQQYTVDDYAAYNLSGGVSAKSDPAYNSNPALDYGKKPTGFIAAGQAFYVNVLSPGGKVNFNNGMRVGGTNNGQFFRTANTSKTEAIEKHRIWLNMTNEAGAFKQLLVGYIQGATNDYDTKYDGLSFDANPYLDFYSVSNTEKFVIQGRALPFTDTDIVPLGYRTTVEGDYTISIDEVDDNMNNQAIYIEDKTTGAVHDLRTGNYTFKSTIGTFTDRLVLRYTAKTLGTGDFENQEDGILVSVKNKVINLVCSKENIKEVTIYDIAGKLIYTKKKVGSTELQIQNLPSANQVLLVKITLENDFTTTRKIIFQ